MEETSRKIKINTFYTKTLLLPLLARMKNIFCSFIFTLFINYNAFLEAKTQQFGLHGEAKLKGKRIHVSIVCFSYCGTLR